ncbi:MAG: hypothetical protein ACE5R6_05050 [Candidatus Heimdallarchaeota archaeon]
MTISSSEKEPLVKNRLEIGRLTSLISTVRRLLEWKRKPSKADPPSKTAEEQLRRHENVKLQMQTQVRSYILYR